MPVLTLPSTDSGTARAKALVAKDERAREPSTRCGRSSVAASRAPKSEQFGLERGACSGALAAQAVWSEIARGATSFLDETGDIPVATLVELRQAHSGLFDDPRERLVLSAGRERRRSDQTHWLRTEARYRPPPARQRATAAVSGALCDDVPSDRSMS